MSWKVIEIDGELLIFPRPMSLANLCQPFKAAPERFAIESTRNIKRFMLNCPRQLEAFNQKITFFTLKLS
jgi:hypothetical protein